MYGGSGFFGELAFTPAVASYQEAVTAVAFDGLYELLWAGSSGGRILTFLSPTLEYAAFWPGHTHAVSCLAPLPGSDLCLSVAADSALLCASGGVKRSGYVDKAATLQCGCLEPGAASPRSAYLGTSTGTVLSMDLATGRTTTLAKEVLPGTGLACMKPGLGRGVVALATTSGRLALADPRAGFKVEASSVTLAHPAGVAGLEVRDGHVACCGFALRAGVPSPEPYVKVFDVRGSLLRPLLSLLVSGPGGGPSCLAYHPQLPSLLLVGCTRGAVALADTAVGAIVNTFQAETGGNAVTSCAVSSVGECWALGDAWGCVRLWADSTTPRVHAAALHLQLPPHPPQAPLLSLQETDSFALAHKPALDPAAGTRLLSDVDSHVHMSVGLAPRVIDPTLLPTIKQVDFVGHLANPHFVRAEPYGTATAKVAALRNKRVDMKAMARSRADAASQRAERARTRLAAGGVLLPSRFHRVEVRAQAGLKFEEFDYAFYNRSRFAGLENDLPNSYANALLQVLYFTPELRAGLLSSHKPEPDAEFCMACEAGLLFRMMAAARGAPVQAANLLRALRQMREAAALGLLDANPCGGGSAAAGAAEAAHDVSGLREHALARRCAALSRFLLETLYKEGNAARTAPPAGAPPPRSGIVPQPAPSNASLAGLMERLFTVPAKHTLQCLSGPTDPSGSRPHRSRDVRVMQVDLTYPSASHRGASARTTRQPVHSVLGLAAPVAAVAPAAAAGGDAGACASPRTPTTPRQTGGQLGGGGGGVGEPATPPHGNAGGGATGGVGSPLSLSRAHSGALSPVAPGRADVAQAGADVAGGGARATDASFAELLQAALQASQETRAWFDDARGYAWVRSSRVPTQLPTLLVVSCPVSEQPDVWWWQPEPRLVTDARDGTTRTVDRYRLPWAVRVEVQLSTGELRVRQASRAALLAALPPSFPAQDDLDSQQPPAAGSNAPAAGEEAGGKLGAAGGGVLDAVYELCAVVAHVRDFDDEGVMTSSASAVHPASDPHHNAVHVSTPGALRADGRGVGVGAGARTPTQTPHHVATGRPYDGHLVAMVKVPGVYWDEPGLSSPCTEPPLGAGAPLPPPVAGLQARLSAHKPVARNPAPIQLPELDDLLLSMGVTSSAGSSGTPKASHPGTDTTTTGTVTSHVTHPGLGQGEGNTAGGQNMPPSRGSLDGPGLSTPTVRETRSTGSGVSVQGSAGAGEGVAGVAAARPATPPLVGSPPRSTAAGGRNSTAGLPGAGNAGAAGLPAWPLSGGDDDGVMCDDPAVGVDQQGWLLFNDFSVSPLLPHEVLSVFGGQKLPCLLHFRRVDSTTPGLPAAPPSAPPTAPSMAAPAAANGNNGGALRGVSAPGNGSVPTPHPTAAAPVQPPTILPVLTAHEFALLCRAPPLQGNLPGPPKFLPLDMGSEAPRPGTLLALDAEFVMVGAPERLLDANLEVLTRQSRLSLGRVSVLRGEGPQAGTPCIDDYVRAVEPVLDHLTRYSGLLPGDLDPSTSSHHLTTMKHAYLKLRYLVDCGCVFVGHGLNKDLRIINITVPPCQLVDTVELFSRWRQRKMSLRFLASYLLGTHIQSAVHDSVEDARTALRLYECYKQLVADNTFQAKLDELYAWGARYGWEPVMLDQDGVPIPPTPTPAPGTAAAPAGVSTGGAAGSAGAAAAAVGVGAGVGGTAGGAV